MEEIAGMVEALWKAKNAEACQAMKQLEILSQVDDRVCQYWDEFIKMLDSSNSYVRTRGLTLLASNAKWADADKLTVGIDAYLRHLMDEKPITARQCIRFLPRIAQARPELVPKILEALRTADMTRYKDSMRPLLERELGAVLKRLI